MIHVELLALRFFFYCGYPGISLRPCDLIFQLRVKLAFTSMCPDNSGTYLKIGSVQSGFIEMLKQYRTEQQRIE
jgi:hypothetical protein